MVSEMASFLIGAIFATIFSIYAARILIKSKVDEMIKEATSKKIIDLEFDNSFLKKKLIIANREHNKTIEERNNFARDFNDRLKGL
jgi:hypothetical protein